MNSPRPVPSTPLSKTKLVMLPLAVAEALGKFLLDKGHGSLTLNFQDGTVRTFEVKEHHRCTS